MKPNNDLATKTGKLKWGPTELMQKKMNLKAVERKPGRPRAIPEALIPKVLSLYEEGLGYRAVARELRHQGIYADWSTVRRIIKGRPKSG